MANKFYVTTAIDYVNAEPHIGHAYQKIIADVLSRWNSVKGKDVWFLTGTDEHGKKVQETAEKNKISEKKFVDKISQEFKEAWDSLNITPNRFIRTTDEDHKKIVQNFIKKCYQRGDIYKGIYEGLYCVGCEQYYTEKELIEGKCPYHPNRNIEKMKEETYFFRLSKYQKFLLDLYNKHPEFILPKERRNEIVSRVKEGLRDFSISRTNFNWGVPFPLDNKHVVYVWFDALINYLSGAGKNEKYWPADLHLLGKDNTWFHTVYWPAMLKSAGYKIPKTTFNHGFLSFNGLKISKSLGNSVSIKTLVKKYNADSIRYFCLRQFPFSSGEDGNFDERALVSRHNDELANKLGNLISRLSTLSEKHGIKKCKNKIIKKLNIRKIEEHFEKFEFDKILNEIFGFLDFCNAYIQNNKIWETGNKEQLYELVDSIRVISILLWPFIPTSAEKIAKVFNFEVGKNTFKEIKNSISDKKKITKAEILFSKIKQ